MMLLCDFHIHTTYSDGSLDLEQTVDIFGQAGFDVIAVTDHVVNGDNPIGKVTQALAGIPMPMTRRSGGESVRPRTS